MICKRYDHPSSSPFVCEKHHSSSLPLHTFISISWNTLKPHSISTSHPSELICKAIWQIADTDHRVPIRPKSISTALISGELWYAVLLSSRIIKLSTSITLIRPNSTPIEMAELVRSWHNAIVQKQFLIQSTFLSRHTRSWRHIYFQSGTASKHTTRREMDDEKHHTDRWAWNYPKICTLMNIKPQTVVRNRQSSKLHLNLNSKSFDANQKSTEERKCSVSYHQKQNDFFWGQS